MQCLLYRAIIASVGSNALNCDQTFYFLPTENFLFSKIKSTVELCCSTAG